MGYFSELLAIGIKNSLLALARRKTNKFTPDSPRRAYNLYCANINIRGRFEWLNRSSSWVAGGRSSGSTRTECYQAFSSSSFISLCLSLFLFLPSLLLSSLLSPLLLSIFFDSSLSCKTDRRTYYAVYVHVIIPSMARIFKSLESLARDTLWID